MHGHSNDQVVSSRPLPGCITITSFSRQASNWPVAGLAARHTLYVSPAKSDFPVMRGGVTDPKLRDLLCAHLSSTQYQIEAPGQSWRKHCVFGITTTYRHRHVWSTGQLWQSVCLHQTTRSLLHSAFNTYEARYKDAASMKPSIGVAHLSVQTIL